MNILLNKGFIHKFITMTEMLSIESEMNEVSLILCEQWLGSFFT
jgi:hypothetical protein